MKVTKSVKYNYKLTEETIEKDIDSFIQIARRGYYGWDHKEGNEGLRIIKQYFRLIQAKLDKNEFEECKNCYKKLILFLFDASTGRDEANFGYEDLLARISSDFDKFIKNYFICLVKTCNIEQLADECSEYAARLKEYGFDSDIEVLKKNLDKPSLERLTNLMLSRTEGMTKKDENKHDIIYFIMNFVQEQRDKKKYLELCNRFKGILKDEEVEFMVGEYDEGIGGEEKE